MTLNLDSYDFPDPSADDPVFKDPNRVAHRRRPQLSMDQHVTLLSDVRGTKLGEARERKLRPSHMKKVTKAGLGRRKAVVPDQNAFLWVEECLKVKVRRVASPRKVHADRI